MITIDASERLKGAQGCEVELCDYIGIELEVIDIAVDDEYIESRIRELVSHLPLEEKKIPRAVAPGDRLVFSCEVKAKENGRVVSRSRCVMTVGEGSLVAGFEEKILGCNVGSACSFELKLPFTHVNAALRGQDVCVRVQIEEAWRAEPRILDDCYVREISEFDSLDDFRQAMREQIEAENVMEMSRHMRDRAANALLGGSKVVIPQILFDSYRDGYLASLDGKGALPVEGLPDDVLEGLQKEYAIAVILDAIAEAEGLAVDDEELASFVSRLAEEESLSDGDVRQMLGDEETYEAVLGSALREKAMGFVLERSIPRRLQ